MLSLTNRFRLSIHQATRARLTPSPLATCSRWKSFKAVVDGDPIVEFNSSANDELQAMIEDTAADAPVVPRSRKNHRDFSTNSRYVNFRPVVRNENAPPPPISIHDFTPAKRIVKYYPQRKRPLLGPGAKESRAADPFYQLGINPLNECMNSRLLSHFVTDMGKIRSRAETNLTWKTQRRLAKAIRRAKMMGVIPILAHRTLISPSVTGGAEKSYQQSNPVSLISNIRQGY